MIRRSLRTDGLRMSIAIFYILAAPFVAYWATRDRLFSAVVFDKIPAILKLAVGGLAIWTSYPITPIAQHYLFTNQASANLPSEISALQARDVTQITAPDQDVAIWW